MVDLLIEHGVEVTRLTEPIVVEGHNLSAGDWVVPLAQPYRPFVKEVMEIQHYPVRHYTPDGEIVRPYDITSWSLPLHFGVATIELETRPDGFDELLVPFETMQLVSPSFATDWGVALDPRDNASYRAVFSAFESGAKVFRAPNGLTLGEEILPPGVFVIEKPLADLMEHSATARSYALEERPNIELERISRPRVALIETWFHDMDAGWTRYLFESYGIPYTLLRPGDVAETDLGKNFDVIIFPDADSEILSTGKYKSSGEYQINDYRPEYRKGLGEDGSKKVDSFIEGGGLVVAWGRSTELFFDDLSFGEGDDVLEFELPVSDDSESLSEQGFYAPGSLLAVDLVTDHPVTWGMPSRFGVFTRGRPVLGTSLPMLIADRRVLGVFPEEDILLSGYAESVELLAERPAMVWVRAGRGQLVFFGFQPQFRASTPGTFKLLFNSVLLPKVGESEAGVAGVTR